ncbi:MULTISPECIES: hypothetical protein [Sphingomonas]|jgi:hypothetical protein|uniref:Uncharacterized protein n=1 Tax=Sphingomonas hankookensis TaxID=563996 RepID=A0ABR5YGR2_9SPHN|nr:MULTISPECIES: hypothetical protein [Sphingomonas]KZE18610.1 hypothetical protein AVT10_00720 [Sphingomonas hankookensis]PZT94958.1 MAG: hypothetical protein DI625_05330 [Sphingomonas sp.]RSV33688.1 hypothetical protein CA237_00775 [Sphingomonas sp. ABOLH]WCP70491.1 hypothetical protein PPZ50_08785 [Sphingomonas hankookensis]
MSDWFSTAIEMQREILRAQQAQLDAAKKLLDTAETRDMAEVGKQIADAQAEAWTAWARFWGSGK